MVRILKTDTAWLFCKKCKNMEEHRIYLKEDGTEVKHCIRCRHNNIPFFEVFGRQQPSLNLNKKDIQKQEQYGRFVA